MANIQDLYMQDYGQHGSIFADAANGRIQPPTNKVFVAITFLADTQLETLSVNAGGLTADASNDNVEFIGTDVAAHNEDAGSETFITGSGGVIVDGSNTFPSGVTIYGRWTSVEIKNGGAGLLIAYIGR